MQWIMLANFREAHTSTQVTFGDAHNKEKISPRFRDETRGRVSIGEETKWPFTGHNYK